MSEDCCPAENRSRHDILRCKKLTLHPMGNILQTADKILNILLINLHIINCVFNMFHYLFRTLEMTLNHNLNANNVVGTPSRTSHIIGFGLVEMATLTIPKPTICRNSYANRGLEFRKELIFITITLAFILKSLFMVLSVYKISVSDDKH